jgi:hypothetical protein
VYDGVLRMAGQIPLDPASMQVRDFLPPIAYVSSVRHQWYAVNPPVADGVFWLQLRQSVFVVFVNTLAAMNAQPLMAAGIHLGFQARRAD